MTILILLLIREFLLTAAFEGDFEIAEPYASESTDKKEIALNGVNITIWGYLSV